MPKHEVFISYTHLDNEPDLPGQEGWISIFRGALETRLQKLLGRKVSIWWDRREIKGIDVFDDVVQQACDDSALMVAVLSPRYVLSKACQAELDRFTLLHREQPDISRLCIVHKTPLHDAGHEGSVHPALHSALGKKLGYPFHYTDELEARIREVHIYDPDLRPIFQRRVESLAQDLADRLRALKVAPPAAPRLDPPVSDPVFLAAVGSDAVHVRDAVWMELTDKRIPLCGVPAWTDDAHEVERQVRECIEGASIAVHLVGSAYGSRPEDSEKSIPELQFDLVESLAKRRAPESPLGRIIWIAPNTAPKSPAQQAFIDRLRRFEHWNADDELLEGTQQELLERILAKRAMLAARREERARRAEDATSTALPDGSRIRRIYVISCARDHDEALPLERAFDLPDWEVLSAAEVTADSTSEDERERYHQDYLSRSDAFLIFHGKAQFRWVRAQADEAKRAFGQSGGRPRLGSVYVSRPLEGPRATYRIHGVDRIEDTQESPRDNLKPFIEQLAQFDAKPDGAE